MSESVCVCVCKTQLDFWFPGPGCKDNKKKMNKLEKRPGMIFIELSRVVLSVSRFKG